MTTALEELTAEINRHYFLREFSFDRSTFRAACETEVELADHVIALPDQTLIFQVKERNPEAASDTLSVEKWFKKKVLGVACRQLGDSEHFLSEQPSLVVSNQRGHQFDLATCSKRFIKVVLYSSGLSCPSSVASVRHKVSKRAGFVHVMSIQDYFRLCAHLAVPSELCAYVDYRMNYLLRESNAPPSEAMLAAMFITEADAPLPPDLARQVLHNALVDVPSFDLGPILEQYGERAVYYEGNPGQYDYYRVLAEFTRLDRAELRVLKKLIVWALESAGSSGIYPPLRMCATKGTGFVVFPVPKDAFDNRLNALRNFTALAKYDWRLNREIGIAVARDGEMVEIDWEYLDAPWTYDATLEEGLSRDYPFLPTPQPRRVYRYCVETPPTETVKGHM